MLRGKEDKYYIWLKTSAINRKLVYFLKHTFRYLIINISSKIFLLSTGGTNKPQSTEEGGPVWVDSPEPWSQGPCLSPVWPCAVMPRALPEPSEPLFPHGPDSSADLMEVLQDN